ncbi:GNAT family N-acetyltransferase [Streptomyces sp. NPDC057552]|uniref:GNAT family N-acetyltransferase n=1 Tax=Streptomyces sp. NPDC057552 TaxID=3350537 RepID=UPI003687F275
MTGTIPHHSPAHPLLLQPVAYDHADARRLTQALHQVQVDLYGFADDPRTTPSSCFRSPNGLFLVARRGPVALGCGGVRHLQSGTAEIKRMYVIPAARGTGAGQAILRALEEAARQWGAGRIILETGARNHAALALYTKAGYARIEPYAAGRDPQINRALSKRLQDRRTSDDPER